MISLKKARKLSGMTQAELAAKVGTTQVSICQYEKGVRIPNAIMLKAIADALEVPIESLYEEFDE